MTKEEVLQKVNDYCNEKSYTNETLTDDFKDKFAGFFYEKYKDAEGGLDSENVIADLKFSINTAFSATSKGVTSKKQAFEQKEADYKRQIAELNEKLGKQTPPVNIPKEVQDKLDEFEKYKNEQKKTELYKEIIKIAKKDVRQDLHKSLENYASDFQVNDKETAEEQAKKLTARFQEIFKDSIGNIKPLSPVQTAKFENDAIAAVPKIKI